MTASPSLHRMRHRARVRLDQARATKERCPRRFGRFGRCGAFLERSTDGHGRELVTCPACLRFERGVCRDCPRPVAGAVRRARRCASCTDRVRKASKRRSALRHRERYNKTLRDRLRASAPEEHAQRNEYKRLYRLTHPEKVKGQKQRGNAKAAARQKARRDREREQGVVVDRRSKARTCLRCSTPCKGRRKLCVRCKATQRREAEALLAARPKVVR